MHIELGGRGVRGRSSNGQWMRLRVEHKLVQRQYLAPEKKASIEPTILQSGQKTQMEFLCPLMVTICLREGVFGTLY